MPVFGVFLVLIFWHTDTSHPVSQNLLTRNFLKEQQIFAVSLMAKTCSNLQRQPFIDIPIKTIPKRMFTKFTGKDLCWSYFLNKVADCSPTILSKKTQVWRKSFSVKNSLFPWKTVFFVEQLGAILSESNNNNGKITFHIN